MRRGVGSGGLAEAFLFWDYGSGFNFCAHIVPHATRDATQYPNTKISKLTQHSKLGSSIAHYTQLQDWISRASGLDEFHRVYRPQHRQMTQHSSTTNAKMPEYISKLWLTTSLPLLFDKEFQAWCGHVCIASSQPGCIGTFRNQTFHEVHGCRDHCRDHRC